MDRHDLNPANELLEQWPTLRRSTRLARFAALSHPQQEDLFLALGAGSQARLVQALPQEERRSFVRLLAPDDAVDLVQETQIDQREHILTLMDDMTRQETNALLTYRVDAAGGLMNPRFARLRPDASIDEAITYLRQQLRYVETIYYAYVLDDEQRLLGVLSLKDLVASAPGKLVRDVMTTDVYKVSEDVDQEAVAHLLSHHGVQAVPVVDPDGRMKGIITADDLVDVVREEDSEDMQKVGGMEALDDPYMETSFRAMLRKRAGWLVILFLGEMLTATAMAHYEQQIEEAVVLALFVPLIISSGGNSGSQATTLVIRAMALGEIRLRDWWRVAGREVAAGLALGCLLGAIGFARIVLWQSFGDVYGEHYLPVATTIGLALVGVVSFGTIAGSMLPFILRRCGLDPASASAPFVATLVDVTGLIIYFSVAKMILTGTLL